MPGINFFRANVVTASYAAIAPVLFIVVAFLLFGSWKDDPGPMAGAAYVMLLCAFIPLVCPLIFSGIALILGRSNCLTAYRLAVWSAVALFATASVIAGSVIFSFWDYEFSSGMGWMFMLRFVSVGFLLLCILILPFSTVWLKHARSAVL